MSSLKKTICDKVIFNQFNRDAILKIINDILNNTKGNEHIDDVIALYVNHDTLSYNVLYDKFVKSMGKYFGRGFSKKECVKYLILLELKSVIQNEKSYYEGLSEIENILKHFNRSYENYNKNTYGEMIEKLLSEIMHDFDIETSYQYAKFDNEQLVIENINKAYKNSEIDPVIVKIIKNLEE